VRFPLNDQASKTKNANNRTTDKCGKKQDLKPKTMSCNKKKKPPCPQSKISNLSSVEKIYNISSITQTPSEHQKDFLSTFKNQASYSYPTGNIHLASTIRSFYHTMYENVGDGDSFGISWTDLINEDNIIDEIAIGMT